MNDGEQSSSFALSHQQAQIWALSANVSANSTDLMAQIAVPLDELATLASIRHAVAVSVDRHEILRTTIEVLPGRVTPVQTVHPRLEADVQAAAGPLSDVLAAQRMSFANAGSPLRVVVVDVGTQDATLVVTASAFAADLASMMQLADEIREQSFGRDDPSQYPDYVAWQADLGDAEGAAVATEFWRNEAAAIPVRIPFQVEGAPATMSAITISVPVDREGLRRQSQRFGVGETDFVHASWVAWLARLSGETDIAVAHLFDGRSTDELDGAVGAYSRYALVRCDLESDPTFAELVATVCGKVETARSYQDFATDDGTTGYPAFTSCTASESALVTFVNTAHFPIELQFLGDRLDLVADSSTIASDLLEDFANSIAAIISEATPTSPVSSLALFANGDEKISVAPNVTDPTVVASTFTDCYERQAVKTPDRLAVRAGAECTTYRDLDARANQVAYALSAQGVVPGSNVGLMTDRSGSLVVGILGILKAGAAYVPLNQDHPSTRLAFQINETQTKVVVTTAEFSSCIPEGVQTLMLDDDTMLDASPSDRFVPSQPTSPQDPAYVLYTSGSTGTPKGVVISHANLVNYARYMAPRLEGAARIAAGDGLRYGVVTAISTDLGNTCVFPSLLSGGCIELISQETAMDPFRFAAHNVEYPIDVLKITPSHLGALFGAVGEGALPRKVLVLGGEACSWDLVARIKAVAPELTMLNHYGPTETTIGACTFDIDIDIDVADNSDAWRPATVPIGRPILNTTCDVVDTAGRPVPIGFPGELLIGGAGVATGYVGESAHTNERFVVDQLRPEGRVYRTGDLVRRLPDGNLEFLGRIDQQLKIRGHRVEPSEIERCILEHVDVRQVAVVAREFASGDVRLVAYYVADRPIDSTGLQSVVAARLPEFMVPSMCVRMEALPLTPSGKLDRRALPDPTAVGVGNHASHVAPRTDTEALLAAVWAEVLGVPDVGVDDDFFVLGGHSLLAMQVIARARHSVGVELPLHSLFVAPTIAGLAVLVDELRSGAGDWALENDNGVDDELTALLEGMSDEEIQLLLADE